MKKHKLKVFDFSKWPSPTSRIKTWTFCTRKVTKLQNYSQQTSFVTELQVYRRQRTLFLWKMAEDRNIKRWFPNCPFYRFFFSRRFFQIAIFSCCADKIQKNLTGNHEWCRLFRKQCAQSKVIDVCLFRFFFPITVNGWANFFTRKLTGGEMTYAFDYCMFPFFSSSLLFSSLFRFPILGIICLFAVFFRRKQRHSRSGSAYLRCCVCACVCVNV